MCTSNMKPKTPTRTAAGYGSVLRLGAVLLAGSTGFISLSGFVEAPEEQASLTSNEAPLVGIRVLRPSIVKAPRSAFASGLAGAAVVHQDALSGAPRLITGTNLIGRSALTEGLFHAPGFAQLALAYVSAHKAELGVTPADLKINESATLIDKDDQFISYHVYRDGLLVQDANIDFRFKLGQLAQVSSQTYSEAVPDTRPPVDGLDRAAGASLIANSATKLGEVYRVVANGSGYSLVRVTQFDTRTQDGVQFFVEVESATAKVFEIRPTRLHLDGSAKGDAYTRTYYQATAVKTPYPEVNLSYTGGTTQTDDGGVFTAPDSATPAIDGLNGKRVNVIAASGTTFAAQGSTDTNGYAVLYNQGTDPVAEDKTMAQSMTYVHVNKEINHARQYITNAWFDKPLTVHVNLTQTCNAFWDGSTLNLFSAGKGCANTGLIADVYYHEWGHGLHANSSGIDDRAYSEGFADTLALMMTHSSVVGLGFKIADGSGVRDMKTLKVYPKDANQEVHTEGLIIGGSFYDLFLGLQSAYGETKAGDLLSKFALKSIYTCHKYTDVYAALQTIDAPSAGKTGPNFCIINKAFAKHGLATADTSCQ